MYKYLFLCIIHMTTREILGGQFLSRGQGSFTNYVNMEKLYTLEDELITISDVILHQERSLHGDDDIHGIYDIASTIESVKDIHRDLVSGKNVTKYIVHPINMYHMTKRLVRDWSKVVKALDESKSCAKAMRVKVQNIADNLPQEIRLTNICKSILKLQNLYDISVKDLTSGYINGMMSLSPLSLDESFEIARVAYDSFQYTLAVDLLEHVTSTFDEDKASFNLTNAMSVLSSTYFKLERPNQALKVLEDVLEKVPGNINAERNKKFIKQRIVKGQADTDITKYKPKSKTGRLVQQYCGQDFEMDLKKQSRLVCTYVANRDSGWFIKPTNQMEILNWKPFIVLFHNMTTSSQQKAVSFLGYERMRDTLYKKSYNIPEGIDGLVVEDYTRWKWIPTLQKKLQNIHITNLRPDYTPFTVKNIGMDGYTPDKINPKASSQLGTFVVFLSEGEKKSGSVLFPNAKTRVTPTKGSILFYETKAQNQMTMCPVLADTHWVGVYPLNDHLAKNTCHVDPIYRPKLK